QYHPFEFPADDRHEGGTHKNKHRGCHHPVIDAIGEQMALHPVRRRGNCRRGRFGHAHSVLFDQWTPLRMPAADFTTACTMIMAAPATTNQGSRSQEAPITTSGPP